jgi:hypothetical protein
MDDQNGPKWRELDVFYKYNCELNDNCQHLFVGYNCRHFLNIVYTGYGVDSWVAVVFDSR